MDKGTQFIPLMSPNITDADINEAVRVIKSGMLVQGEKVALLEKSFCQYLNSSHASALSNGTATLHLALKALGIGEGDEVIVPAFSYIATANVVEIVGAKPVFVDIDLGTFNIDVTRIEAAITPKTKAIMPVHEFGLAAEISKIKSIAETHHLYVIEDAACALGATENEKLVGTFGDFGSFSLHPRKAISSGEGGVLITHSLELDKKVKILRNHGVEIIDGEMEFVEAGYNYRMTDFQAALVNSQMIRLQNILDFKQSLAEVYYSELKDERIQMPFVPINKKHSWQTFHIIISDDVNRNDLIGKLKEKGVGTNYGAQCMPYMKFFQEKYRLDCSLLFPNALKAYKQGLALPIYEKLDKKDIEYIAATLQKVLRNYK